MKDELILLGVALLAIIIGASIFLFGSINPNQNGTSTNLSAVTVPFTQLAQGEHSTVAARVNYAITSADQLAVLWKMINATGTPPAIDFNTNTVIAVFGGEEKTATYTISVSKVEDASARVVTVMLTKPDGTCKKQTLLAPYELVIVPKTSLPLSHEDEIATTSCPR